MPHDSSITYDDLRRCFRPRFQEAALTAAQVLRDLQARITSTEGETSRRRMALLQTEGGNRVAVTITTLRPTTLRARGSVRRDTPMHRIASIDRVSRSSTRAMSA